MGLEKRGNNFYFYEKVRRGSKVVSQYVGTEAAAGPKMRLTSELDTQAKLNRQDKRAELAELDLVWRVAEVFFEGVDTHVALALQSAGFKRHNRGEWRKTRNVQNKKP